MAEVTLSELSKELESVEKFFSYHQIQVDAARIEFGWVESEDPIKAENAPVVIARSTEDPSWDNVATLADYRTFFVRLTSMEPREFIDRWSYSEKELKAFWSSNYPSSEGDQHEFVMKLAHLIDSAESFEMYGKRYENFQVVEADNGESRDEAGEVS